MFYIAFELGGEREYSGLKEWLLNKVVLFATKNIVHCELIMNSTSYGIFKEERCHAVPLEEFTSYNSKDWIYFRVPNKGGKHFNEGLMLTRLQEMQGDTYSVPRAIKSVFARSASLNALSEVECHKWCCSTAVAHVLNYGALDKTLFKDDLNSFYTPHRILQKVEEDTDKFVYDENGFKNLTNMNIKAKKNKVPVWKGKEIRRRLFRGITIPPKTVIGTST